MPRSKSRFTDEQIPDLSGKRIVITGSSSGIGYEAARMFAGKGAEIVLAVRSLEKGQSAAEEIRKSTPAAKLFVRHLDLSSLESVKKFAEEVRDEWGSMSVLVNNAGVMAPPLSRTKDGFELQFGTNHLGHFALTARLFPLLQQDAAPRIVVVSSMAHRNANIDFNNLDASKGYSPWRFYGQSKLANLMFAYELDRRLKQRHIPVKAIACHPGFAATNLLSAGFGQAKSPRVNRLMGSVSRLFAQSAYMGALPTVYAAIADLHGGEYIGPTGPSSMRGYPGIAESTKLSHDREIAKRLWEVSEELTQVKFTQLDD